MFKRKEKIKTNLSDQKRRLLDTVDYTVMILTNLLMVLKIARLVILNKKARKRMQEEEEEEEY